MASTLAHGVYYNVLPTPERAIDTADSAAIVAVGTAPVHMLPSPTGSFAASGSDYKTVVNAPILTFSYADVANTLGYTGDWADFTLSGMVDAAYIEANVAPVIFINVLDPEAHCTVTAPAAQTITNNVYTINAAHVIYSSVIVQNSGGTTTYVLGTDYSLSYNQDTLGNYDASITITLLSTGAAYGQTTLKIGYAVVVPSQITSTNVIGGVQSNGTYTGLQAIDAVFPLFQIVPGILVAPGWSQSSTVAAAMLAVVQNINGCFNCICLIDVDSNAVTNYTQVSNWKTTNNIVSKYQVLCWPKVKLGTKVYWLSTQLACLMAWVDARNGSVPYASPSNNNLWMDAAVVNATNGQVSSSYTQLVIPGDIANYLNYLGVVTVNNFGGRGWVAWGNYTSAATSNTDPSAQWIPAVRYLAWFGNTTILTCFQFVDNPANLRLVESVEATMKIFVNAQVAAGALLGGDIQFLQSDNPVANLLAGQFSWRAYLGVVLPAQDIQFLLQYDTSYLATLFASQSAA